MTQATAAVTVPSRTMEGFSLYENAIHRLTIQYPTNWNKQEIPLNNGHTGLEVMFVVPIEIHFLKTGDSETISDKIRYIIYDQFFPEVVLSFRKLPIHENYTLQDITYDHKHELGVCFDNVDIVETSYDYIIGKMPSSKLLYTYTDRLQNHLHKEGMKIIGINGHKEISITYTSRTEDFDRFLPTVRRMIDTVSIEDTLNSDLNNRNL